MNVDSLFRFILSWWNFPNQITWYNVIDIFENLTMNRGALTWVESFWSYNAKVIDYWTIFLINMNKIINRNYTRIQRFTRCCFKVIAKLYLMKFISYSEFWMNYFVENSNKLQQIGFRRKMSWVCSHLAPTTHVTLFIHEGR